MFPDACYKVMVRAPPMLIVDLDGTLLASDRSISERNMTALRQVREQGGRVVAATGRSLGSVRAVLTPDAPIDAVAFSTGAGTIDWSRGEMLGLSRIARVDVEGIIAALLERDHSFMLHAPDPEDGTFAARRSSSRAAADFDRRVTRYGSKVRAWSKHEPIRDSLEILLIEAAEQIDVLDWARNTFSHLSVIHATSPIDHRSLWIQLLAGGVGKAAACQRLAERWGIAAERIVGVGNDYNDVDFLDWVGHSYIVENAPAVLRSRYSVVASNDAHGVAAALEHFRNSV